MRTPSAGPAGRAATGATAQTAVTVALAVLPAVRVGPEGSSAVPQESAALTVSVARAAQAVP
ncbi:hypothetical protein, partial [Mycobacterium tuberculosis]|uniref:hypothetical protein n=1 Tax=Mycobacterium tuberculosis TaxID=1773 RepID=UPI002239226B